jgi:4-hydroxy-tetrahydrodipicolinate reductase
MIDIIVTGAAGRMGMMITAAAAADERIEITGALERDGHPSEGLDIGLLTGLGEIGVPLVTDPGPILQDGRVMIDFTSPGATVRNAALCAEAGLAMVIGTTGLDSGQQDLIRDASRKVPVVFAPNMSVGVNLTFKIIGEIAGILGEDYDLEIVEAHHRKKKDSPSGTAVRMLEILAHERGLDAAEAARYGRQGMLGPRTGEEIGVFSVRGGDIVGEHTVIFAGADERVEVTHRAHSRATFARGAVRASVWVAGKEPGLYDMADVLGLK